MHSRRLLISSRGTLFGIEKCLLEKIKAYDTGYSKQVTQPSTNPRPTRLNLGDRTRTGAFTVVWS